MPVVRHRGEPDPSIDRPRRTALAARLKGRGERWPPVHWCGWWQAAHHGVMAVGDSGGGSAGHRLLPHTADVLIAAWAPTEADCLAQAVAALAESFAEVPAGVPRSSRPLLVRAVTPEERLVAALEEVVYALDVDGVVPTATRVETVIGDEVRGVFDVVPLAMTRCVGPPPKAVTRHGLRVVRTGEGWRCEVVVDV